MKVLHACIFFVSITQFSAALMQASHPGSVSALRLYLHLFLAGSIHASTSCKKHATRSFAKVQCLLDIQLGQMQSSSLTMRGLQQKAGGGSARHGRDPPLSV
jgi:hypothetical protein